MKLPPRCVPIGAGCLAGVVAATVALLLMPPSTLTRIALVAYQLRGLQPEIALPVPLFPMESPPDFFDWRIQRVGGSEASLSDFDDKVLFVSHWASWCEACKLEIPAIQRLWEHFRHSDIAFLLISQESDETVRRFAKSYQIDMPIYVTTKVPTYFDNRPIPLTIIVDQERRFAFAHRGAALWDAPSAISYLTKLLYED